MAIVAHGAYWIIGTKKFKYLNKAIVYAEMSKKYLVRYYQGFRIFKALVVPKVKNEKGINQITYNCNHVFKNEDMEKVIKEFYEFSLKRICIENDISFKIVIGSLTDMKLEDLF